MSKGAAGHKCEDVMKIRLRMRRRIVSVSLTILFLRPELSTAPAPGATSLAPAVSVSDLEASEHGLCNSGTDPTLSPYPPFKPQVNLKVVLQSMSFKQAEKI